MTSSFFTSSDPGVEIKLLQTGQQRETTVELGTIGSINNDTITLSKTLSNPADSTHVLASVDRLTGVLRLSDSGNWNLLGFPTTLENIDLDNDGRDNDGDGFYDGDDTNGEGGIIAVRYGINPGGQGLKNFSIVADPNDPSVFYVGGDRQPHGDDEISGSQSSIDADTSSNAGRLFRGVVDATGALVEWQPITHTATTNNSAPHAEFT